MRDCSEREFERLERELLEAGISEEEFSLENYIGLTRAELQSIVDTVIARKRGK